MLKKITFAHDANKAYGSSASSLLRFRDVWKKHRISWVNCSGSASLEGRTASFQGSLGINLFSYCVCWCLWCSNIFLTWPRLCLCTGKYKCTLLNQHAVFPVVSLSLESAFQCECSGIMSAPAYGGASYLFVLSVFFLARLKKFLRKNRTCKRYVAPSPSAGMSTVNSTILWNSLELVANPQTQITCSWETTWTEVITRWRR